MFQVSRIYTKNELRMENFAEYYNYLQQEKLCLSTPDFQTPFFAFPYLESRTWTGMYLSNAALSDTSGTNTSYSLKQWL